VTLPFETVRRRLQVQVRGTARPIKACVELRPVPYNGVVDTLWRVVTEERSDLPLKRRTKRGSRKDAKGKERDVQEQKEMEAEEAEEVLGEDSWLRHTGIGQLYRGLGMRVGASVIVFFLAMLGSGEENAGWAEL
jgi:mitochondrial fusion and transport protein UGO1